MAENMRNTALISFRLPDALLSRLDALAQADQQPRSGVIRRLLEQAPPAGKLEAGATGGTE